MDPAERALSDGEYTTADAVHGSIQVVDGVAVLAGELDYALSTAWLQENPVLPSVTGIDARRVSYLGSAGMVLMVRLVRASRTRVALQVDQGAARRVLEVAGLMSMFDVADTSSG